MATPIFPTLPSGKTQDASKYGVSFEDPSMQTPLEGGYVVSRAKYTRAPRRTFNVGYSNITAADKLVVEAFWQTVKGGSVIFDWLNTQDKVTYKVRFKSGAGLSFQYVGSGKTQLWNFGAEMMQA